MDEAAAALDALQPAAALTYAEAGGWGRALMLECRRRGIPSVGLQHGFIYRHWLNYLHESDEMAPDRDRPADAGFPHPTMTLLFDEYARRHLEQAGRFPAESLAVTGSPRLDALVVAARALSEDDIAAARASAGAASRLLVLLVAKHREVRHVLPALTDAIAAMPGVQLAIKTHPAETPDAYGAVAAGRANIRVLPASAPLAPLLRASRAIVTMNSTVALDAAVLGVPALVIGLPNNLSPFVEAGIMAGARLHGEIGPALQRILYDEGFRQQLERDRIAYLSRYGIASDGRAAERAADAVLAAMTTGRVFPAG
jgi:UDP-N-acetylglucosamine 2-epimerase